MLMYPLFFEGISLNQSGAKEKNTFEQSDVWYKLLRLSGSREDESTVINTDRQTGA